MVYHHLFDLKEGASSEGALSELSHLFSDLYEIQDVESGNLQIGGYAEKAISLHAYQHVLLKGCDWIESLDWEAQWAEFAPGFDGSLAHISLGAVELVLLPGAGFGDCSHPTTRLMLSMMPSLVKDRVVLDIGCGSGVLSVAAALWGAKRVYGIDIEREAIEHSKQNAHLNGVEDRVFFSSSLDPSLIPDEEVVILMNMIESQQHTAWESVPYLYSKKASILTSGVLSSKTLYYKDLAQYRKWSFKHAQEEEGWMAFLFYQN